MKRSSIIISLCIMAVLSVNLQAVSLLENGLHSRASGMGGAFAALADDSSAVYYNPALLYDIEDHLVSFGYSHLFHDANNFSFSYVFPKLMLKPDMGISIAFNSLMEDGLKSYSTVEFGNPGDYTSGADFELSEYLVMGGLGIKIVNVALMQISGGFNFKYFSRTIDDFNSSGIAGDLGINAKHRLLNFAVVVRNLLGKLDSSNDATGSTVEEKLPLSIKGGLLLQFNRIMKAIFSSKDERPSHEDSVSRDVLNWVINPVVDAEIILDDETELKIFSGVEGWINNIFALRFGYNNFQGLSYGFSAQVEPIRIDYSYMVHSELNGTHRITGTYMF
ncbi:MAG: PorV/PorQ family protein [Spirochaetes bacterium]|nr:PorV/PorQ family protein [Spirochaetota bacterium]